jgi:hypothetical protein
VFMDHYVPWPGIQRIRRLVEEEPIPTLFDALDDEESPTSGLPGSDA